jgi:large subunit ribosomal protein L4
LSVHAARDSVAVFDGASYSEPSTKQAAAALAKWNPDGSVLVLVGEDEIAVVKSFRNIPRVTVLGASAVGVADVIGHASLVISNAALEVLETRASEVRRGVGATGAAETGSSEESERSEDSEESQSAAEGKDSEE